MKIRTQFILTMLLFSIVLAVITVSWILTTRQIEKVGNLGMTASDIAQGAGELGYLSNDYLIHRESHQLIRWRTKFSSFAAKVGALRAERPEQQALIGNIQANQNRLKEVFDSVVSAVGNTSLNQRATLDPAFLQVSWSRMAVQSQGLVSDASRLSLLFRAEVDHLRQIRTILMYLTLAVFAVFLLITYAQTFRRILKSIAVLQAGTAVIGSGNLDFVIEEKKNDEIGELSHSFNRMTAALKMVTASKADLEREMAERKRTEEALAESSARYRSLFENMINGFAYCRMIFEDGKPQDFIYLEVNPAFERLTGLKDVVGKKVSQVIPGIREANPELFERYGRVARTGVPEQFEVYVETLGMWFAVSVYGPAREHFVAVFDVITERKRAEVALRQSEERLRLATEGAGMGTWDVDLRTGETVWNQQHFRNLGYDPNIFVPSLESWQRLVHPEDLDRVKDEMEKARREHALYRPEYRIIRAADGQIRWLSVMGRFIYDEGGHAARYIGVCLDITERKRMEEELRQAEEKSRLLIKYAPSMLYEIDFRGPVFKSVNDAMCQFLGYTREELLAMSPFELLDDEGKALFRERIRRQLAGEVISDSVEYKSKTRDGREVHGVLKISFTYKDGKPEGAVVVAHDITERKRAEEALRKAHDELGKRVQERTSELSEAVQRLRAEIIQRRRLEDILRESENQVRFFAAQCLTAQETERKRVAGELHDSIAATLSAMRFRIDKVAEEMKKGHARPESLLDIGSKITEVNHEVRRIMVDLRPSILDDLGIIAAMDWFCREYQKTYAHLAVEKQVGISENEVPDSLKTPIFRISQEAMNNIAKYGQASLVTISLRKEDGRIRLMIQDNGQGFDLGTVRRGLGLSTMRERAELSGGSFHLESALGKGTTIRAEWSV